MNKAEITIQDLEEIRKRILVQIDTLTIEKDEQVSRRYETRDPYQRNQIEHRIVNLDNAMDALDAAIEKIKAAQIAVRCAGGHGWK